jgi:hypothetical protein
VSYAAIVARFSALVVTLGTASVSAAAAESKVPAQNVTITVNGSYSDQWTKVFQEGGKWICQSSVLPYFEASKDPLLNLDWSELAAESKLARPGCRDQVTITDSRTKTPKKITSCMNLPQTKYWVDLIGKRCGRL